MPQRRVDHPSLQERRDRGLAARNIATRSSHAGWEPAPDRADPILLLEEQNRTREPDLVPVRHGRMLASPLTFYRGAAKIMAGDLRTMPRAGLIAQLCGDAHLSNFGVFASPERALLFDLNDFDETLPGPFEYDVKRLCASFTIAAHHNGFTAAQARDITETTVRVYRETMAQFAEMTTMEVWYARLGEADVFGAMNDLIAAQTGKVQKLAERAGQRAKRSVAQARGRDSLQALAQLAEKVDGGFRIRSQPPILVPARDLGASFGMSADELQETIRNQFQAYRETLQNDRRHLLERFDVIDVARKVVGVGSVGTRAYIALLQGRDQNDPLFLQVKEATTSVLEDHLPRSRYRLAGQRVVQGQRLMQASSDIFLGWTRGVQQNRHLYWRQLRDMKGSSRVEAMIPMGMEFYARQCAWTLARAHARSGDPVALAAYLGANDKFDRAITNFAEGYRVQNERDYDAFVTAVRSGRIDATEGV